MTFWTGPRALQTGIEDLLDESEGPQKGVEDLSDKIRSDQIK